jgi:hypothetical protein
MQTSKEIEHSFLINTKQLVELSINYATFADFKKIHCHEFVFSNFFEIQNWRK